MSFFLNFSIFVRNFFCYTGCQFPGPFMDNLPSPVAAAASHATSSVAVNQSTITTVDAPAAVPVAEVGGAAVTVGVEHVAPAPAAGPVAEVRGAAVPSTVAIAAPVPATGLIAEVRAATLALVATADAAGAAATSPAATVRVAAATAAATPASEKSPAGAQSPRYFELTKGGGVSKQVFQVKFKTDLYSGRYSQMENKYGRTKSSVLKYYCDAATYFGVQLSHVCGGYNPEGREARVLRPMMLLVEHCNTYKQKKKSNDFFLEQLKKWDNGTAAFMFVEHVLRPAITQASMSTNDHDWMVQDKK